MTELDWLDVFGDNLASMLYEAKYTQKDLAEMTGLSEATISKYLKKQQMPGVRALINISIALDCSLDDLMYFGNKID